MIVGVFSLQVVTIVVVVVDLMLFVRSCGLMLSLLKWVVAFCDSVFIADTV